MAPDDSTSRVPLGPVGGYVMRNMKELRQARGLTYKELAERLRELGREIPTLGLSRIEKGARRVDADDLVALALALGVNPSALLLPRDARGDAVIDLTAGEAAEAELAWAWMDGRSPMLPGEVGWDEWRDFARNARPSWLFMGRDEEEAIRIQKVSSIFTGLEREGQRQATESMGEPVAEPPATKPQRPAVITAIVTSPQGVLIGKRNDGKPPWTFIAGENEPMESPADTIVREVKEETGLEIIAGDILGERVHPKTGRHMVYVAARPARNTYSVIVGDPEELAEVRWASLAEADELLPGMFEPVREHLAQTLGEE